MKINVDLISSLGREIDIQRDIDTGTDTYRWERGQEGGKRKTTEIL